MTQRICILHFPWRRHTANSAAQEYSSVLSRITERLSVIVCFLKCVQPVANPAGGVIAASLPLASCLWLRPPTGKRLGDAECHPGTRWAITNVGFDVAV